MLQSYLRRHLNVHDRRGIKTLHHKGKMDSKLNDHVDKSIPLESHPFTPPSDSHRVTRDVTHLTESLEVDTGKVLFSDAELGDNTASSQVNDANDLSSTSEMSHTLEVSVEITSYTESDSQPFIVTSCDTEPGTKSNCSADNAQTAAIKSDVVNAVSDSSSFPVNEVSRDVAADLESSSDHMGEALAADVRSDDTESLTEIPGCLSGELPVSATMNGTPAVTGLSRDVETDSKSCSDTVSDMSSSSLASRDQEVSSVANSSEVSSVPVVMSHDTETGTKSISTGQPSPGRYLRKSTTANHTGSPSTSRKSFPRTSTAYIGRTSSVDSVGSQKLSEVSLSSSTDTGLSVASTSRDQDLSRKPSDSFSVSAELQSPSRHVRHSSEPHIVTKEVSDAVCMDIRATTEQTTETPTEKKTAAPSSRFSKYAIGTVSAPTTPQRVKLCILFSAC